MGSYGVVTINGKQYIEREQTFPFQWTVADALLHRTSLQLPGQANFWLKSLSRETIVAGASVPQRFLFRLGNSDGGNWYQNAGVGGVTDLVIDTLLFGSGQFPFVLSPFIFYSSNASITMMIQDISLAAYTIFFAFRGSYLIPVEG